MPSAIEELTQALETVNRTILKLAQGAAPHDEDSATPEPKAMAPAKNKQNPEDLRDKARNLLKTIADLGGGAAPAKALLKKVTGELRLSLVADEDLHKVVSAAETELAEKQAA